MLSVEEIKIWILVKLYRRDYWGHCMMDEDDLVNPKIPRKDQVKILKEMINKGILLRKPGIKSGKFRYSLNLREKAYIENIVKKELLKD